MKTRQFLCRYGYMLTSDVKHSYDGRACLSRFYSSNRCQMLQQQTIKNLGRGHRSTLCIPERTLVSLTTLSKKTPNKTVTVTWRHAVPEYFTFTSTTGVAMSKKNAPAGDQDNNRKVDECTDLTSSLMHMIEQNDTRASRDIFNNLISKGQATKEHFELMMTKACHNSEQQRCLINVKMHEAGLLANVTMYNALISQLIVEGDEMAARRVIDEDMEAAGIRPDAQTWKLIDSEAVEVDRMRSHHLSKLLSCGHQAEYEAAWDFFEGLVAKKKASRYQFNLMMKQACRSSEDQRRLLGALSGREGGGKKVSAVFSNPDAQAWKKLELQAKHLRRMRTKHLSKLLSQKGSLPMEAAQKIFRRLLETKQVDAYQFVLMMKANFSFAKQQQLLKIDMCEAGIRPTLGIYNTMIKQLMLEDEASSALKIAESDMPAVAVQPDERTWKYLNLPNKDLREMRTWHLLKLISKGKSVGNEKAWDIFNNLISKGQATKEHFELMMTKACHNSEQQRCLINVKMHEAGLLANVTMYNALISQLIVEGDEMAARRVIDEDMEAAGIRPDAQTWKLIDSEAVEVDRMRSHHLSKLLSCGHQAEYEAAWDFFEGLVAKKKASRHQFNLMMKQACRSSEEQQHLLEVIMSEAGVKPGATAFNTLITQLIIEGDKILAHKIIKETMPASKIKPDNYTLKCFDVETQDLDDMRLQHLSKLMSHNGDFGVEVAWNIFHKLVKRKQASINLFNLMLTKACHSSNEQQRLIDVDMPQANIIPDATTHITLVKQLLIEGNVILARKIVSKEMPASGIKPNLNLWATLHRETSRKERKKNRMTFKKLKRTRRDDKERQEKEKGLQRKRY